MNTAAKVGLGLVGVALFGTIIYFAVFRKTAAQIEEKKEVEPQPEPEKDTLPPPPPPVATERFPLDKGMRGPNIRAMQTALINKLNIGISGGATGFLGNNTSGALSKAGYSLPISEGDYNMIIAGQKKGATAPPPSATSLSVGQTIYAKNDGTPLYTYPSGEAKYIVVNSSGDPIRMNRSVSAIGTIKELIGDRWIRVSVNKPQGSTLSGENYFVEARNVKTTYA